MSYSLSKAPLGQIFPKIASRDPLKTTTEENKAIMEGTIAYYGTYSVSEPDKALTLRIVSEPGRSITELTGDQLKSENTTVLSGGQIHVVLSRLKLRRASKLASPP